MCVAVPARVLSIGERAGLSIPARVAVAGTERAVDLALVPDARVGDYVVVHSGYGISLVPQDEALRTLALLAAGADCAHGSSPDGSSLCDGGPPAPIAESPPDGVAVT